MSNCKTRMNSLDKIWSKYEINHSQILREIDDEIKKSNYFKQNEFDNIEEVYLKKRSEFLSFFDSLQSSNTSALKTDNV